MIFKLLILNIFCLLQSFFDSCFIMLKLPSLHPDLDVYSTHDTKLNQTFWELNHHSQYKGYEAQHTPSHIIWQFPYYFHIYEKERWTYFSRSYPRKLTWVAAATEIIFPAYLMLFWCWIFGFVILSFYKGKAARLSKLSKLLLMCLTFHVRVYTCLVC